MHSALFVSILGICYLVFQTFNGFPGEESKQKNDKKFIVMSLGLGAFIAMIVISLLIILFFAAALGLNATGFIQIAFPFILIVTILISIQVVEKRKENYLQYGLGYEEEMEKASMKESETSADPIFYNYKDTVKLLYLLGLDESVTLDSLNQKYKELAGLYHPDRLGGLGEKQREVAEEEFKRITHAKEVIKGKIENGTL